MAKPTPEEKKKQILEEVTENGMPTGEAARRFGVKKVIIESWLDKEGVTPVEPVESTTRPEKAAEFCLNPSCPNYEGSLSNDLVCKDCGFDKNRRT